jgi:hypothetical protein
MIVIYIENIFKVRMPYVLEKYPGAAGGTSHRFAGKAIVVNTKTGHHFSKEPIPTKKAEAQMRLLESLDRKTDKK